MTETELSLLGSLSSISAMLAIPFSGMVLDGLGRKNTCVLFCLLQLIGWTIVIASTSVEAVMASIFVSGITCTAILAIPLYVSEICQDSIRGSMSSGVMMFYGLGMLISYLLGGLVEYHVMNYTCLSLTVLGMVLLCFVKESPLILIIKGNEKEAAQSIAFYRGVSADSKEVEQEIAKIKRTLNPELDEEMPEEEILKPEFKPKEKLSTLQFIKKSRSTRRAMFVCLILSSSTVFQGLIVVQVYAAPLFEMAIPSMSATVSSVIFAVVTIVAGIIAAYLVEAMGRKSLMVYASAAAAISCVALGTQIQFNWGPHWVAAVFIYLYTVTYTVGAGTIPYMYYAEVFLPEIRNFASMLSVEWTFLCFFIVLFIFNPVVNSIGLGAVFYIFAAVCLLTSVFCLFFMPETKGRTIEEIQLMFASPKSRNKV
ncbi:facilitated trehalose transporter Tret1-like [Colias croceus]|uniref:facilitated trehalose transporter Tret1-like n=1 Tax=Colias crocea TaxID=72248 RepID=UPI001E281A92|nr:facilitated trehalose transporter Tret1-like [Colias croceus]